MMTRYISMILNGLEMLLVGAASNRSRCLGVLTLCTLMLVGCGEIKRATPFEPVTDGSKLFGALTLDHRAINLSTTAPYDTIRLTAIPRNMRGEPLEGLPAPTFRSADTVSVWVTEDGLVQARRATSGVAVIAELVTGDNVRHADTAIVKVSAAATPPQLASFAITFDTPELAEWPITAESGQLAELFFLLAGLPSPVSRMVTVTARDDIGNPVLGLEIDYISLDPDKVIVNRRTGVVEKVIGPPGEAKVLARTTAYGTVFADTATVTILGPVIQSYFIQQAPDGSPLWFFTDLIIRPGGYVAWYYSYAGGAPLGITFDDATGVEASPELCATLGVFMAPHFCEAGNIAPYQGDVLLFDSTRIRQFNEPGIYDFNTTHGVRGRVRVVADDDPIWDTMRGGK